MPINTKHPEYEIRASSWESIRDVVDGEVAVRQRIEKYLPVPPGLLGDSARVDINVKNSQLGSSRYQFYTTFAELPEIVPAAINAMQGLIHEKPPEIELPEKIEYLLTRATPDGDTLLDLWENTTREVLTAGRMTLLREIEAETDEILFCPYIAESLINWRLTLKCFGAKPLFVVLAESVLDVDDKDPYNHVEVHLFRELAILDGTYVVRLWRQEGDKDPVVVKTEDVAEGKDFIVPSFMGQEFEEIPITVINATDIGFDYGPVPALPMTKRALAIFRKTADYNRSLYIKGDPQPILWGVSRDESPDDIGGGTLWVFSSPEGRAEYLDIEGDGGVALLKGAIDDEYARFHDEQGKLRDAGDTTGPESGEAIRRKQAAKQVTLKSLVISAAAGFERAIKDLARMLAVEEAVVDTIKFSPHLDFAEPAMTGEELLKLITSKNIGAPLSEDSLHALMVKGRLTKKSFEEELELLGGEGPNIGRFGIDTQERTIRSAGGDDPGEKEDPISPVIESDTGSDEE